MFLRLLLLFTLVPIIELALLIQVGQMIGTWNTVLLILITGTLGVVLAKSQGAAVYLQFREDIHYGRVPGMTIISGILVLIGSAFLLTPGLVTDTVGFILLLPFTRLAIVKWLRRRIEDKLLRGDADFWIYRR